MKREKKWYFLTKMIKKSPEGTPILFTFHFSLFTPGVLQIFATPPQERILYRSRPHSIHKTDLGADWDFFAHLSGSCIFFPFYDIDNFRFILYTVFGQLYKKHFKYYKDR